MRFVNVHVVYPYSSIETVSAWKISRLILSDTSDFHLMNSPSIADLTITNDK